MGVGGGRGAAARSEQRWLRAEGCTGAYAPLYNDPRADQWVTGKGALTASRAAVDEFSKRAFAGVHGVVAAPSTEGARGRAGAASAGALLQTPGPVVAWLQRAMGDSSGSIIELGARFEQAARVRPPQLDLAVRLPALAIELTDAQVREGGGREVERCR